MWPRQKRRNRRGIQTSRQDERQLHADSGVPNAIKEQPVLSPFWWSLLKTSNGDGMSKGSGTVVWRNQLLSLWTGNWTANGVKSRKRDEGVRGPFKSPPQAPLRQATGVHRSQMAERCRSWYKICLCPWWGCGTTRGERIHFTCGKTRGIAYREEKFPLRVHIVGKCLYFL